MSPEKRGEGPVGTNGVVNLINYYYKEEKNWRGINSSSDI